MKIVEDLMVPLEEYIRVPETASLYEAIEVLEEAQLTPGDDPLRPKDRAVLVQAPDGQIVGKLSLWDLLRGLEPRYGHPVETLVVIDDYFLPTHSLMFNLAEKAKSVTVKELLYEIPSEEMIKEDAPLDAAVHQLIRRKLLSLLVMRDSSVVGILRLSDVFRAVTGLVKKAEAGVEPV